jgi:hypothetical protein
VLRFSGRARHKKKIAAASCSFQPSSTYITPHATVCHIVGGRARAPHTFLSERRLYPPVGAALMLKSATGERTVDMCEAAGLATNAVQRTDERASMVSPLDVWDCRGLAHWLPDINE